MGKNGQSTTDTRSPGKGGGRHGQWGGGGFQKTSPVTPGLFTWGTKNQRTVCPKGIAELGKGDRFFGGWAPTPQVGTTVTKVTGETWKECGGWGGKNLWPPGGEPGDFQRGYWYAAGVRDLKALTNKPWYAGQRRNPGGGRGVPVDVGGARGGGGFKRTKF